MRLAFDGLTPSWSATAARFRGSDVDKMTSTRSCVTETRSSTEASDCTTIAFIVRLAAMIGSRSTDVTERLL